MKRDVFTNMTLGIAFSVFLLLGALTALAGDEHKHHKMQGTPDNNVTLVGEVLDLYCFMEHPQNGQGLGHAQCAQKCINKGLPIGFLTEGEVYLLLGQDHESAKDVVVNFAGMQSRLTGKLIDHHGVKSIEVVSIEKIDVE